MNGTSSSSSNQSATASRKIDGAKGRNDSRRLIFGLRMSFMSARRGIGDDRCDRLERRGPHSMRPLGNQPTQTLPSAIAVAVRRQSAPSPFHLYERHNPALVSVIRARFAQQCRDLTR